MSWFQEYPPTAAPQPRLGLAQRSHLSNLIPYYHSRWSARSTCTDMRALTAAEASATAAATRSFVAGMGPSATAACPLAAGAATAPLLSSGGAAAAAGAAVASLAGAASGPLEPGGGAAGALLVLRSPAGVASRRWSVSVIPLTCPSKGGSCYL